MLKYLSKILLWAALVLSVAGAAVSYRYFSTTPELRFAAVEARYQAAPFVILVLLSAALLLRRPSVPPRP